VEELLFRGHPEVVDADLADYFGSIPRADLLKSVARRIVDRRVLHLIKMWLDCPVEETDDRGRKTRTTEARDKQRGIQRSATAQGTVAVNSSRTLHRHLIVTTARPFAPHMRHREIGADRKGVPRDLW